MSLNQNSKAKTKSIISFCYFPIIQKFSGDFSEV
jgi:hypothetical protein